MNDHTPIKFAYRNKFTRSAKKALQIAKENNVKTILDYGCGKSLDVYIFRQLGFYAIGWDKFLKGKYILGSLAGIKNNFDMVTCLHVLHVVAEKETRNQILTQIKNLLRHGGYLIVTVDKVYDVNRVAKERGWTKYRDGYINNKNHFYRGFSRDEIILLVKQNGFNVVKTFSEPLTVVARTEERKQIEKK